MALERQAAEDPQKGQERVGVVRGREDAFLLMAPPLLFQLGRGRCQRLGRLARRGGRAVGAVEGEEVALELCGYR